MERQETIRMVCAFLDQGETANAACLIDSNYPFIPVKKSSRAYTPREMTKVFLRDGFIDRFRGTRLVYPPVLRVISHYLPKSFPYHQNWKMDEGHIAYWEIYPTIDHIIPVSRRGEDIESNWVCCSMITNSIKSNWLLEELEWTLKEPGDLKAWDGLISWFIQHTSSKPELLKNPYIKSWYYAAKEVL